VKNRSVANHATDETPGSISAGVQLPVKAVGRPRKYASDAERKAAYLERHDLVQLNLRVTRALDEALDAYMARHAADGAGLTKSQVVENLIKSQLLRKR